MSSSSSQIMIHTVTAGEAQESSLPLPVKEIPGSCGIPFLSSIRDRLDFYYFQGQDDFFKTRIERYGSTVFRVNMPPGPFMAHDPRVIAVLDAKSFDVLFDVSRVEKRNFLCGTYMPSTSLTGGYRVCAYLDPSEPNHAKIKQLLFTLLASRKSYVIPSFRSLYSSLFETMESQLTASPGAKSDFNCGGGNHIARCSGHCYVFDQGYVFYLVATFLHGQLNLLRTRARPS